MRVVWYVCAACTKFILYVYLYLLNICIYYKHMYTAMSQEAASAASVERHARRSLVDFHSTTDPRAGPTKHCLSAMRTIIPTWLRPPSALAHDASLKGTIMPLSRETLLMRTPAAAVARTYRSVLWTARKSDTKRSGTDFCKSEVSAATSGRLIPDSH